MRYETALQKLDGQSAGGQLIVHRDGRNILVGRHHDGHLIVEDTDAARELVQGLTDDPLDHDNDGRKGGGRKGSSSRGRGARAKKDPVPVTPQPAPAEAPHHAVVVSDDVVTADQVGGSE